MTSLRRPSKLLSEEESEKLSQIIQNFFLKASHVIIHFRAAFPSVVSHLDDDMALINDGFSHSKANNRWFNLDLGNSEISKTALTLWKNKDILALPPLVIETYLDLRGLNSNQTLMLDDVIIKTSRKSEIVLERWLVEFDLTTFDNDVLELPSIYKKTIILFRSLYLLAGLLPSYKLRDKLSKSKLKNSSIHVSCRILDGSKPITSKGRIGLSKKLADEEEHSRSKNLEPILTPIGALRVSVSYRKNCNFQISDNEELLSSHFMLDHLSVAQTESYDSDRNSLTSPTEFRQNRVLSTSTHTRDQSPRRRSSTRSVQLFKVGSINSSSSPPPGATLGNQSISSFTTSKPIPVTLNRTNSSASLVAMLRQNRDSLPKSIGSTIQNQPVQETAHLVPSNSRRFSSSFGSRIRTTSSRNNSLDGQLVVANPSISTPTNNPILNNFRTRNKSPSVSSTELGQSGSLYMDDDLDSFMKMLDSKPDLRFTSNSPSLYDDTLANFKNMQKSNDFFGLDPQQRLPSLSNQLMIQSHSQSSQPQSFKRTYSYDLSRRGSISSNYSPSSQTLKPSVPAPMVTPSVSYGKFHASSGSPSNSSLAHILRRNSSPPASATAVATVQNSLRRLTSSSQRTNTNSTNSSNRPVNPELLKFKSFNQEVFESDDEDHDSHSPLSTDVRPRNVVRSGGNAEDDEDDLLFAMSDMTLAKNNQEF
ncbi:hypothetical protein OGAPHI_003468 [Ogataea philodendri]|uniref:Autophagy-related protein 13 n=1 Tax=Ogataea philodendri TaxID=1378263 RepID=A0A9P8P700_9ASCO|nr:uncharacterized protein OGAPHI_003468 [Ogataea philodendri]KAH3666472.1 hypothetical protein OGAPHI_003468 [Ogataea philodendri]